MRIIARKTLKRFWQNWPDSEEALKAWYSEAKTAVWNNPTEIKTKYGSASILKNNRVVFNICGNKYRMVVHINYSYHVIYVRFIGTHAQYDACDVETV